MKNIFLYFLRFCAIIIRGITPMDGYSITEKLRLFALELIVWHHCTCLVCDAKVWILRLDKLVYVILHELLTKASQDVAGGMLNSARMLSVSRP